MSITSLSKQQSIIGNQSNHVKIGIIGTANVGKSSLFNVIARHSSKVSPSENALFTTIDPFFAAFFPHDHRIEYISQKMNARAYPVGISVVDTAGIVAGSFREVSVCVTVCVIVCGCMWVYVCVYMYMYVCVCGCLWLGV